MARRPTLTDQSFLAHLFKPSKNLLPSGLRKRTLKGAKGQTRTRLRSYNRMSPVNQAIIDRTGKRDSYLKGEISFRDLKGQLREQAQRLGITKPPRRRPQSVPASTFRRTSLDRLVQAHLKRTVVSEGRRFNDRTSDDQIIYLDARDDMLDWEYGRIKYAGRKGSEYEVVTNDGVTHNPFWYH